MVFARVSIKDAIINTLMHNYKHDNDIYYCHKIVVDDDNNLIGTFVSDHFLCFVYIYD